MAKWRALLETELPRAMKILLHRMVINGTTHCPHCGPTKSSRKLPLLLGQDLNIANTVTSNIVNKVRPLATILDSKMNLLESLFSKVVLFGVKLYRSVSDE